MNQADKTVDNKKNSLRKAQLDIAQIPLLTEEQINMLQAAGAQIPEGARIRMTDDVLECLMNQYRSDKVSLDIEIGANVVFKDKAFVSRNVKIKDNVIIGYQAFLAYGAEIGSGSCIGDRAVILYSVQLGGNVTIGDDVTLYNKVRIKGGKKTTIGKGATIGTGSIVEKGINIIPQAIIGPWKIVCELESEGVVIIDMFESIYSGRKDALVQLIYSNIISINDLEQAMTISWSEGFYTGIEEVDQQHFQMIRDLNELGKNLLQWEDKDEILERISKLRHELLDHFMTEEKYRVTGTSYISAYQQGSLHFSDYLETIFTNIDTSDLTPMFISNFYHSMFIWIIEHEILKIDQLYNKLLSMELVEKEPEEESREAIHIEKDPEDWSAILEGGF